MTDKDAPRDAQIRADALDLNSDVFMAAGAGSGKTTVLVDRYMAALDAGVPPREVVAITFTRKAASEMRQRLRKECRDRIAEANADASRHWRQVADELEVAPINTIHGFCSSLLRRFALRAGVDPQFRVLQERSGWLMRQRAITETILQRLDDEKPTTTRLFSEYSRGQIEGIMDGLLNNREFFEDRLQHPPSVSDVQEHWNEIRDTLANDALRSVIGASKTMEALTTLREHPPVDPATKFSQEREVVLEALDGAGAVDMDYSQRWELAERALKAAEVTKSGASPEDWGGKENWDAVRDALNAVKTQLRNWRQQQEQLDDDAVMDDAAALAEAVWTEASACLQAYEEAKAADSSLDFVDLQLLIRKLLHADAQVRNQCRDRYRHVLVDEFQDTNDLQRDIVFAITGFVDDSRSPDAPKLFVVGDAKQSIYGFRNADVRVFRHTREQFAEASGAVRELALEVAFRSTASLTGYHNWLFDHETIMGTAEKPDYEARFEPLQAYRDDHPGGMAGEMLVTDVEAVEDENGEEKRPNAEQRREAEAATLAARLKELRESGFEVVDEDTGESRPMQWGDIALLLRATSNINLYENALRRHEIPFYTIGGIGFWTRQEVMDLLNMIRVLNNFNDDVALAGVLRSPLFGFDDNELYRVARAGETLFEGIKTVATGEFASEYPADPDETVSRAHWTVAKLERFRMLSGILPLSRLLDRIIDETGYSGAMAAQFGGERRIANIRKLVDVSRGFERDGNYGLDEFVRYVETLTEAEDREGEAALGRESADLVKLLTVHKAKGLEWPIVVIPDASRDINARQGPIVQSTQFGVCPRYEDDDRGKFAIGEMIRRAEFDRDLAEHRRLLYVAATRARDYLIISGAVDRESPRSLPRNSWMQWVLDACGQDLDTLEAGETSEDGWMVQLRVQPPTILPQPSREKTPLVERHTAKMRAGEALQQEPIGTDLRRRVRDIRVSARNLKRISVTALATYRACPLEYALMTRDDLPGANSGWGLGRLSDSANAMQMGTFVHLVLEMLGRSGLEELEEAIETARKVPDVQGMVSARQIEEVRGWLENYLRSDLYDKMMARASYLRSEAGVTFPVNGVEIEGKVDALVESNTNGRHVLDYKTGRPNEHNKSKYVFQIGLYCEGIRRSLGELPQTATLMYLSSNTPVSLEPATAAAEAVSEAQTLLESLKNDSFKHRPGKECHTCPYSWSCQHSVASRTGNR